MGSAQVRVGESPPAFGQAKDQIDPALRPRSLQQHQALDQHRHVAGQDQLVAVQGAGQRVERAAHVELADLLSAVLLDELLLQRI